MIGLLQSGTGTGNGMWRPIVSSGLPEEAGRGDLRTVDRAGAAIEDAAIGVVVGVVATTAPGDPPPAGPVVEPCLRRLCRVAVCGDRLLTPAVAVAAALAAPVGDVAAAPVAAACALGLACALVVDPPGDAGAPGDGGAGVPIEGGEGGATGEVGASAGGIDGACTVATPGTSTFVTGAVSTTTSGCAWTVTVGSSSPVSEASATALVASARTKPSESAIASQLSRCFGDGLMLIPRPRTLHGIVEP
jgi:hypothetical protein